MASNTPPGRLAPEPRRRAFGDLQICDIRLAVHHRRGRGGEDRGAFSIDLVALNGLAKICHPYLRKASRILGAGQPDVHERTGHDAAPAAADEVSGRQAPQPDAAAA